MAGEDRAVGRGPADAGHADMAAHDAVYQRGLARSGRADQGHQDRGTGLAQPRQEVVADLAEQVAPLLPRLLHPRNLQRQRGRDDGLAQREDRRLEEPGIHPDVWLDFLVLGRLRHWSLGRWRHWSLGRWRHWSLGRWRHWSLGRWRLTRWRLGRRSLDWRWPDPRWLDPRRVDRRRLSRCRLRRRRLRRRRRRLSRPCLGCRSLRW